MDTTTGDRLREARRSVGLTQREIAEACGVLAQEVSRWERNVVPCHKRHLAVIARLTGTSLSELAGYPVSDETVTGRSRGAATDLLHERVADVERRLLLVEQAQLERLETTRQIRARLDAIANVVETAVPAARTRRGSRSG